MMQDDEYDWVDDDSLDLAETRRRFNLLKTEPDRGQTALFVPRVGDAIAAPRVEQADGRLGQTILLPAV